VFFCWGIPHVLPQRILTVPFFLFPFCPVGCRSYSPCVESPCRVDGTSRSLCQIHPPYHSSTASPAKESPGSGVHEIETRRRRVRRVVAHAFPLRTPRLRVSAFQIRSYRTGLRGRAPPASQPFNFTSPIGCNPATRKNVKPNRRTPLCGRKTPPKSKPPKRQRNRPSSRGGPTTRRPPKFLEDVQSTKCPKRIA